MTIQLRESKKSLEARMPKDNTIENKDTPSQEKQLPDNSTIALIIGDTSYIAKESSGYIKPLAGFFIKTNDEYVVSELTIVKGKKSKKDEKGKIGAFVPATFPVIFYNNNGKRGHCSIEASIDFNDKTISFKKMKVKFEEIPHTLMSLDTCRRFLNNETKQIEEVYHILKARQTKFVSYNWDPRLYDLLACITVATYFFDVFGVFPIVWFFGVFESGKGRGLKSLVYAARKGILLDDPTKASVLRLADYLQPTLGIDEYQDVEHMLRGFIRSSYKEGMSSPRMEETSDGFVLKTFGKFHPVIIASTEDIDYGSFTRTIPIKTKRGNPIEDRDPTEFDFSDIRENLYLCRLTQANKVYDTFLTLKKEGIGLCGREWEIWRAPLTIAKMVSDEIFNNLRSLANEICSSKRQSTYVEEKDVLMAIHSMFKEKEETTKLLFYPKELTEKIWVEKSKDYTADTWGNDVEFKRHYSPVKIGFTLKRMGLKSKYVSKGSQYFITSEEYDKLWSDYGLAETES